MSDIQAKLFDGSWLEIEQGGQLPLPVAGRKPPHPDLPRTTLYTEAVMSVIDGAVQCELVAKSCSLSKDHCVEQMRKGARIIGRYFQQYDPRVHETHWAEASAILRHPGVVALYIVWGREFHAVIRTEVDK